MVVKEESRMGFRRVFIFIIISACTLVTCSFPGDVYVQIVWNPADGPPTSFATDAPNIPATFEFGQYYKTSPGNWTFASQYLPLIPYFSTFNLTANNAVLGFENAYYDVIIFASSNPTLKKVPSE